MRVSEGLGECRSVLGALRAGDAVAVDAMDLVPEPCGPPSSWFGAPSIGRAGCERTSPIAAVAGPMRGRRALPARSPGGVRRATRPAYVAGCRSYNLMPPRRGAGQAMGVPLLRQIF